MTTKIERKSILTFLRSHSSASEDEHESSCREVSDSALIHKNSLTEQQQKGSSTDGHSGFGQRLLRRFRSLDESRSESPALTMDIQMRKNSIAEDDERKDGDAVAGMHEIDYRPLYHGMLSENCLFFAREHISAFTHE